MRRSEVYWSIALSPHKPQRPERKEPKPHQWEAVNDVVKGFKESDRGQLVMACGTGKTLVGLWVSKRLQAKRTLVLLPSLTLLAQTLRNWAVDDPDYFSYLAVCSDDGVKGEDDPWISHVSDLGPPTTTDSNLIARFLRRRDRQVVFAT